MERKIHPPPDNTTRHVLCRLLIGDECVNCDRLMNLVCSNGLEIASTVLDRPRARPSMRMLRRRVHSIWASRGEMIDFPRVAAAAAPRTRLYHPKRDLVIWCCKYGHAKTKIGRILVGARWVVHLGTIGCRGIGIGSWLRSLNALLRVGAIPHTNRRTASTRQGGCWSRFPGGSSLMVSK